MTSEQEYFRRLELVVQNTTNMIVVTDRDRRIEWVNPSYTRVTGWTLEEAQGRRPHEMLHGPETDRGVSARVGALLKKGQPVENVEIINYTKDGDSYWVSLNIQPVFDDAGEITQFVSIQTDITERKRHPQGLECCHLADDVFHIAEHQALRQLQLEPVGPGSSGVEDGHDLVNKLRVANLAGTDVDRYGQVTKPVEFGPDHQLLASLLQHPMP